MNRILKLILCSIVGLSLIFVLGCSNEKEKQLQHRIDIEKSTATVAGVSNIICEIYSKNELKAQKEFENKVAIVGGTIKGVGAFGDSDLLYVDLGTYYGYRIICQFRDVYKKDLAALNSGDMISIQGECYSDKKNGTIYIDGARIVPFQSVATIPDNKCYFK